MGSKLSTLSNWNRTSTCYPEAILYPTEEEEIRKIVLHARAAEKRIRVVGNRVHTWGEISMCDAGDIVVNLKCFNKVVDINRVDRTVTAQAGVSLADLILRLEKERLAFINMGNATEQTLGGVTATGTHGSGGGLSPRLPDSFSDQVLSYKVCDLSERATIHTIRRGDEAFDAFMVHLGVLAVVLEVTLQLREIYHLKWDAREIGNVSNLTLERIRARYEQVFNVSYSFFPSTGEVVEVVRDYTKSTHESSLSSDIRDDFVRMLRKGNAWWIKYFPCCVGPYANVQKRALLSLSGNSDQWRKVLSEGDIWGGVNFSWQSCQEYACPLGKTLDALKVIGEILEEKAKDVSTVISIRFIRGSKGLMACHYSSSSDDIFSYIDVQFCGKKTNPRISFILQNELSKIGCRAHWGKNNVTTFDLITSYRLWPKRNLNKFIDIKTMYDPDNVLGNSYTDKLLSAGKSGAIVMIENGTVSTVLAIDDDEEMSPIALMALPSHTTHKEGEIIPMMDGAVAASLETVAEF